MFLTVEVLQDQQDVDQAISFLYLKAFRKLHIKVILDRCLRIRQHKINLSGVPIVDDGKG